MTYNQCFEPGQKSGSSAGSTFCSQTESALVPSLISRQAEANPRTIAVVSETEVLTYAELELRSDQLFRQLKAMSSGPEQVIAIYLERSPLMLVAALAVMKSGGAYLPIPVDLPIERVHFMLRDAGVNLVISRGTLKGNIPHSNVFVDVDAAVQTKSVEYRKDFDTNNNQAAVAYVIYTSGSSGQPKGVEILHRSLVNLVQWHVRAFQVKPGDRASHLANVGFDAAVWEVWPYLAAGASIHIVPDEVRQDPEALRDWMVRERITVAFAATPVAERLISLTWPSETSLRILLTGADTLYQRPKSSIPFALINNYGPTECTVVTTSGLVEPSETHSTRPSIGRPIDNVRVYVLDENMREVEAGAAGELFIGGAGVARGYINQPQLTAEKFVPNPFAADESELFYRTGDLVRRLPNGELEFLGRCDEQVKIRGYRIEPNEIIRVINEYPGVETSTVVTRDLNGDKALVAYLVAKENCAISGAGLRNHIAKQIPSFMVPGLFVRLEALPVTVNGKIDKSALPHPNDSNSINDEGFVAPRTRVEQRLAPILAHLLRVQAVGINDNFFLLGGHSLLGTQLITKIRQSFGVELSLLSLFDHPTLAGMSAEIEKLILNKIEKGHISALPSQASQAAD